MVVQELYIKLGYKVDTSKLAELEEVRRKLVKDWSRFGIIKPSLNSQRIRQQFDRLARDLGKRVGTEVANGIRAGVSSVRGLNIGTSGSTMSPAQRAMTSRETVARTNLQREQERSAQKLIAAEGAQRVAEINAQSRALQIQHDASQKEAERAHKREVANIREQGAERRRQLNRREREEKAVYSRLARAESRVRYHENLMSDRRAAFGLYAGNVAYNYAAPFLRETTGQVADTEQSLRRASYFAQGNLGLVDVFRNQAMSSRYFGPSAIAEVQRALAQANYEPTQIRNAVNPSLLLSLMSQGEQGGGVSPEDTADMIARTVRAFKMKPQDAKVIADALAATSVNTVATIQSLSESLSYGASTSGFYGLTLPETAAYLGLLSNVEKGGSKPGVLLNSLLREINAPSNKQSELFGKADVNPFTTNEDGKRVMRPLFDILTDLAKAEEQGLINQSDYSFLFPDKTIRGFAGLMQQGKEEFDKLRTTIEFAMKFGYVEQALGTILDNTLKAAILEFSASSESALLDFYKKSGLEEDITGILESINSLLNFQRNMPDWFVRLEKGVLAGIAAIFVSNGIKNLSQLFLVSPALRDARAAQAGAVAAVAALEARGIVPPVGVSPTVGKGKIGGGMAAIGLAATPLTAVTLMATAVYLGWQNREDIKDFFRPMLDSSIPSQPGPAGLSPKIINGYLFSSVEQLKNPDKPAAASVLQSYNPEGFKRWKKELGDVTMWLRPEDRKKEKLEADQVFAEEMAKVIGRVVKENWGGDINITITVPPQQNIQQAEQTGRIVSRAAQEAGTKLIREARQQNLGYQQG